MAGYWCMGMKDVYIHVDIIVVKRKGTAGTLAASAMRKKHKFSLPKIHKTRISQLNADQAIESSWMTAKKTPAK